MNDGPVAHRPACATCGAAGAWREAQRGRLVPEDGRYVCGSCGTTAPVPRRLPCGDCGTITRVDPNTLRREHSWPYGDALRVCRACRARTRRGIRCTRSGCHNTGVPAATVLPDEYLCDACGGSNRGRYSIIHVPVRLYSCTSGWHMCWQQEKCT